MKSFSKILAASAVMLSGMVFVSCDGGKASDDNFKNIDLIPVTTSKDGKWSMINDKGEIVYDKEFKNAPTASYNGYFSVEESDGTYTVYKAGSKKPEAVKGLDKLASVGFFENGLIPAAAEKSRIALYTEKGEKKFELSPIGDVEITYCNPGFVEDRLLFYTADFKYGYFDTKGEAVIKPTYDTASDFTDGMAVVGKKKNEDSYDFNYSVIDKDGKVLFKLKEDYLFRGIMGGYVVAEKDDRVYLYNKKGDDVKLPEKIYIVSQIVDDYIIFLNKDYEYGVANTKGEILINAKYSGLTFDKKGFFFISKPTFLGRKDKEDKDIIRINLEGEKVGDAIDYQDLYPAGKFGYFAQDGENTYVLLDKDFKKKSKEEFYGIRINTSYGGVVSDYFNYEAVAGIMAGYVDGSQIGEYKLGSRPSTVLAGETPSYSNSYTSSIELDKLSKSGFRYSITGTGYFDGSISLYNWNYYTYSGSYSWNPNAKLSAVSLKINTEKKWGIDGQKALTKALEDKGYKVVKAGQSRYDASELYTLLSKGGIGIILNSPKQGFNGEMLVFQNSYIDINNYGDFIVPITDEGNDDTAEAVAEVVEAEPDYWEAVDSVAVEEPYYY